MQPALSRTSTAHLQWFSAKLQPALLQNSDSDSPVVETTSGPPTLPHIDTDPSIKKLLLPDEQSLSDMRIPPIEPIDPAIHVPLLLDTVEERHNLSENVGECDAVSLTSQAPEHTTHTDLAGYRLSTDSGAETANPPFSEHQQHRGGKTIANNGLSRLSLRSTSHSTAACTSNSIPTEFPTQIGQPLPEKKRNNVAPTSFPIFKRIRQFLAPSRVRLSLTQRAVCIAPAQCAEPVVVSPTRDGSRPTNPSPPGEVILLPADSRSMITASEDGTRACCCFFW